MNTHHIINEVSTIGSYSNIIAYYDWLYQKSSFAGIYIGEKFIDKG